MKYIRTKDGRIGFVSSVKDYNGGKPTHFFVRFNNDNEVYGCEELDIITQADTIEELSDYWDFYSSIYNKYQIKEIWLYTITQIKNMLEEKYIRDVKLAIRTDKGLIYVAKMKGILPNGEIDWELL